MPAKKNHYETLGVKKSASSSEIKRKFRQRAERLHPDKGGDHVEMSELNRAYEVLSDPQRRLLYDRTGEDSPRPMEDLVHNLIMLAFTDALNKDAPNILEHAQKCLQHNHAEVSKKIREAQQARDKMIARRDKITRKKGPNAFHMIIDQQLPLIEQAVAKFEGELEVCEKAMKDLEQYKSTEEVPTRVMRMYVDGRSATTTATGTWG